MATRFSLNSSKYLLVIIVITLYLIGIGYCGVTTLKSPRRCLSGCQCNDEDVAICTFLPTDFSEEHQQLNKM